MNLSKPSLSGGTEQRTGPQGTQLLSADDLRRYSHDQNTSLNGYATTREPILQATKGVLLGRRFTLRAGRQTIGRRTDNDIVVDDPSVSAAHAWIINHDGHYMILNTLSTNGTYVNDKRVHEGALSHGDSIRLGQAEFLFLTRERSAKGASVRWAGMALLGIVIAGGLAWWLY